MTEPARQLPPRLPTLRLSERTPPEVSTAAEVPATKLTWAGGDLDVAVGRSLYLMLSTYCESGAAAPSVQTYVAVTWRF